MSVMQEIADQGEQKADLTPMIDMVFQLIIFFVIVNDFSSTQIEPVYLPKALHASTDPDLVKDRSVIVNVLKDGTIRINRETYGGEGIEEKVLHDHMQIEAELAGMEPNPSDPNKMVSKLRVLIRADSDATYEHVQKVFKACAKNGIWKTQIAAYQEELEAVD